MKTNVKNNFAIPKPAEVTLPADIEALFAKAPQLDASGWRELERAAKALPEPRKKAVASLAKK